MDTEGEGALQQQPLQLPPPPADIWVSDIMQVQNICVTESHFDLQHLIFFKGTYYTRHPKWSGVVVATTNDDDDNKNDDADKNAS